MNNLIYINKNGQVLKKIRLDLRENTLTMKDNFRKSL